MIWIYEKSNEKLSEIVFFLQVYIVMRFHMTCVAVFNDIVSGMFCFLNHRTAVEGYFYDSVSL